MAKKPSDAIRARVLGDARITTRVTTIEPKAEILFAAALYLVLERREPVSRRTLQVLLWPDESSRVAAHRLRQTLLKLRQLGIPIQLSGQAHIGLNGAPVSVDYEEFLAARKGVDGGNNDALVMLPAYEPRFSQAYLEWLDRQKAEVNASMTRLMLGIIARHRVKGEWVEVERNASRLLRFQPYNEEATLAMAESCAMRGAKLEAMAILDKYLNEVGSGPTDLRLPATIMRRRIADRMHPRAETIASQSPLVGRSAEMEQLASLLESARHKKGKACIVWGDAGIGKSRLLAEFATFASLQGIRAQRVQCRPSDANRPLSAFVDLVPGLRSMRGAIGCSPETFAYLDRLTKATTAKIEITASESDAEYVYGKVQQSVFDLIDAVTDEGCLIILIEDVHWLDPISAKMLSEMVSWVTDHSILFLFSGRDEPDGWMVGGPQTLTQIHLPPLELDESKELMLGIVRQHGVEINEPYLQWCVRVADGNPYYLQELASQYLETGEEQTVPSSLSALLTERISRLSAPSLQLLQTCVILENDSTLDHIEKVLGYGSHRLLTSIDELGSAGMLMIATGESNSSAPNLILPRHDLLARVALSRLAPPGIAFLHHRAGLVLEESLQANGPASMHWRCAQHWHASGNRVRALRLALSCATHLMDVGLPASAAEAYEKSLSYCDTTDERLNVLEGLTQAYYSSNDWSHLQDIVGKTRALIRSIRPSATRHDDLEIIGIRAEWLCAASELPIGTALGCLADQGAAADHRVKAGVMGLMMLSITGRQDEMPAVFRSISELAEQPNVTEVAILEAGLVYHTICGDLSRAVEIARCMAKDGSDDAECGAAIRRLRNASVALRTAGLFDESRSLLVRALALADRHKLPLSTSLILPMLCYMQLERGLVKEAREWYQALIRLPPTERSTYVERDITALGARFALLDGKPDRARACFPYTLSELVNDPLAQRRAYRLATYIAIYLARGRRVPALALSNLESTFATTRHNLHQAFPALVLYRALEERGSVDRAQDLLNDYVTNYRREAWQLPTHLLTSLSSKSARQ